MSGAIGQKGFIPPTPLINCDKCPFRGAKVASKGDVNSPFMIVGESPGATECYEGKPFMGASGKLIAECLRQAGLPDNIEPFVTNALQCFPPPEDKQGNLAFATQQCQHRLLSEVKMAPREAILALGNAAVWSLTNNFSTKITQIRGRLFQSTLASKGIVASVHPAYLLRGGGSLPHFRADVKYAVDLATGGQKKEPPKVKWYLVNNLDNLEWLEEECRKHEFKTGDIETAGPEVSTNPAHDGFNFVDGDILSLGISFNGTDVYIIPQAIIEAHPEYIDLILSHGSWNWHNGKFDVRWFWQKGIWNAKVHDDTMLMSYALNEIRGLHDLEQVAGNELGAPDYKDTVKPYLKGKKPDGRPKDYRDIPPMVLYNYQAFDVANTFFIRERMLPRIMADAHLKKLYTEVLIPGSETLAMTEFEGMLVDREIIAENEREIAEKLIEPIKIIDAAAIQYLGAKINVNSWQQVDRLIYGAMKLAKPGHGTSEDVIMKLPQVPVIKALREYRKLAKLLGTYVLPIPDYIASDGCIHTTYLLHGTITGRLSSRDINMQNQPRGPFIRRMFIPGRGYKFVKVDLNQAELRVLTCLSGDAVLVKIYLDNLISIHHVTSVKFFGEGYTEEDKMKAKAVNFGIVYGRSAFDIAYEFDLTVSEAQRYINLWLEQYPEAAQYIKWLREAPSSNRVLVTNFGRKKRWGVVSYEKLNELQNMAANFPAQSIASDITLVSANRTWKPLREIGVKLQNLVHDETMWKVPDVYEMHHYVAHKVASTYRQVPIDYGITRVPFIGEAEIGDRWGIMDKKALAKIDMQAVNDVERWIAKRAA